jgi:drug/metabolite transporter (DMT)-like permease
MNRSQRDGLIFVLVAATGYSCLPIFVKFIRDAGLAPLDIATWRFIFAMPIFWLLIALRRSPASEKPLPRLRLLGLGVLFITATLTAFWGLERLPAGTFIILFYTYPAMVALLSLVLGERLTGQSWVALLMTLIGTVLTVPNLGAGLSANDSLGVLLAIINALIVSFYFIFNNRLLRGHTALAQASAWSVTGSFLVFLLLALIRPLTWPTELLTWLLLLALAVVSTVMPIFCLTTGLNKLGPSKAAIVSTVEPILTTIWAMIFLGEQMQALQIAGGALILLSVVLLQIPRRNPAESRSIEAVADASP